MTDKEAKLCGMLLYSRELFLSPEEMAAFNPRLKVRRTEQRPNMAMYGRGSCPHWGIVSGFDCQQMAINTCPPKWLNDGLLRLYQYQLSSQQRVVALRDRSGTDRLTISLQLVTRLSA